LAKKTKDIITMKENKRRKTHQHHTITEGPLESFNDEMDGVNIIGTSWQIVDFEKIQNE
jgi:hypothetical protein